MDKYLSELGRKDPYTAIPNRIIAHTELQPIDKCVLIYLLSRPGENWVIQEKDLMKHVPAKRDSLRASMKRLINAGYIIREQTKQKGKFSTYRDKVYDRPYWEYEDLLELENPTLEKPRTAEPATAEPATAEPATAKPSLINKESTNNGLLLKTDSTKNISSATSDDDSGIQTSPSESYLKLRELLKKAHPRRTLPTIGSTAELKQRKVLQDLVRIDKFKKHEVFECLKWVFTSQHKQAVFWRECGIKGFRALRTKADGEVSKFEHAHGAWLLATGGVASHTATGPVSPRDNPYSLHNMVKGVIMADDVGLEEAAWPRIQWDGREYALDPNYWGKTWLHDLDTEGKYHLEMKGNVMNYTDREHYAGKVSQTYLVRLEAQGVPVDELNQLDQWQLDPTRRKSWWDKLRHDPLINPWAELCQ